MQENIKQLAVDWLRLKDPRTEVSVDTSVRCFFLFVFKKHK